PDTPSPSPSPQLLQLTSNGCCVQPFFSPDSTHLLFLDKPDIDSPPGFWSIPLTGGEPELAISKLGLYSRDLQLVAYPEGGQTYVERLADGQRWTIPNGGRSVSFSPSGTQVAWALGQPGPPFDSAMREIRVGRVDGSEARQVTTLIGGGFAGWVSETQILITGQPSDEVETALWVLSLEDDSQRELARGGRIRAVSVAPGGAWVVYLVTFSADAAQDGLWIQNIATGERVQLDLFGGYRWRDADHILIIPLDPHAASGPVASHQLWEVDAATGDFRALTDPALTPFKVAEGDWTVSPDGQWVAFISATDRNIWILKIQP
ncbi:MAG TPA: hypothetical protein PK530_19255, partial [Anaerolineales bacterium]|nr:hypothetical protein [Anaerolineales bacterium]